MCDTVIYVPLMMPYFNCELLFSVLNVSHWDYFFDFLTHIQKYYMRTSAKDGMSHDPFFWPLKYFTRSL